MRLPHSLCDAFALQWSSEGHLVVLCCNMPKNIFHLREEKIREICWSGTCSWILNFKNTRSGVFVQRRLGDAKYSFPGSKLWPNEIMNDEVIFKTTVNAILSGSAIKSCFYLPSKCLLHTISPSPCCMENENINIPEFTSEKLAPDKEDWKFSLWSVRRKLRETLLIFFKPFSMGQLEALS